MTVPERCTYSDLYPGECDHCGRVGPTGPGCPTGADEDPYVVTHPVAYQPPTTTPPARIATARALEPGVPAETIDYITELVDPTVHYEPRRAFKPGTTTLVVTRHRVTAPSLLEQLASAVATSGSVEDGRRVFGSKPSARIDALDALQRIESGVWAWLRRLGLDAPTRRSPEGVEVLNVSQGLRRAAAHAPEEIRGDVRRWWAAARTVTGWDAPAWKPDNSCPLCGVKGGLRIRRDATAASCVECWEAWDYETIGLLAEHIRAENHEDDEDDDDDTAEAVEAGA